MFHIIIYIYYISRVSASPPTVEAGARTEKESKNSNQTIILPAYWQLPFICVNKSKNVRAERRVESLLSDYAEAKPFFERQLKERFAAEGGEGVVMT